MAKFAAKMVQIIFEYPLYYREVHIPGEDIYLHCVDGETWILTPAEYDDTLLHCMQRCAGLAQA